MSSKKEKILEKLARMGNPTKAKKTDGEQTPSKYVKFDYTGKKNEYLFLPYKSTIDDDDQIGDIFASWNYHKGLTPENPKKEIHAMSNFLEIGEKNPCPINKAILELKKDFVANKDIWRPIEEQIKYFVPVIDLNDIEKGVQWWSYKTSVKKQIENEIANMEDDETFFWDLDSPKKVIITFDKDAPAASMYAVSFKEIKDKTLLKTIQENRTEWVNECLDLNEWLQNYWDLNKRQELIETYLDAIEGKAQSKKEEVEDLDSLVDDDE